MDIYTKVAGITQESGKGLQASYIAQSCIEPSGDENKAD